MGCLLSPEGQPGECSVLCPLCGPKFRSQVGAPYHGRLIVLLRKVGCFDKQPADVSGVQVSPLAFTSALRFPHWTFNEEKEECTVMRVVDSMA